MEVRLPAQELLEYHCAADRFTDVSPVETLALKALTIHSSLPFPITVASAPKQGEAETMARTAVKKDITSHITWHVLGILAKSRKDWEEATAAFAMARKQDNASCTESFNTLVLTCCAL